MYKNFPLQSLDASALNRTAAHSGWRAYESEAQALAGGPLVILPDEPTSHLDLKQKDIIFKLFAGIASAGSIIICATHDIELAKKYATHICLLQDGRLIDFATAKKITDGKIKKVYGL